jgi:outer membrane biosynthesis protein TonB
MPPKKRKKDTPKKAKKNLPVKKTKKNAPEKVRKITPAKKTRKKAAKKPVDKKTGVAPVTEATTTTATRGGRPCICVENSEGWFCMRQLPSGELKECDGPFDTKEECEMHFCN